MVKAGPIDVRSVVNYVLSERSRFGLETTHLSLQKLIFFCHVSCLVRHETPLCDGYFEAWEHGPVHPFVWRELKEYGSLPISKLIESVDLITGETDSVAVPDDPEIRALISEVVLQTRKLSASQLRAISHVNKGPWWQVWNARRTNLASSSRIPDNAISAYYRSNIWGVVPTDDGAVDVEDHPPEPNRGCQ